MSYREENGEVTLTMSRDDYDLVLMVLGYATGGAVKDGWIPPRKLLELTNRLNGGNPRYAPYQTEP